MAWHASSAKPFSSMTSKPGQGMKNRQKTVAIQALGEKSTAGLKMFEVLN